MTDNRADNAGCRFILKIIFHLWGIILFALMFGQYFPTANGTIGHDYSYFIPLLHDGFLWCSQNGLFSVPWFTPSICGGVPFFSNPQNLYYSLPQFLTFVVSPASAIYVSTVIIAGLGYAGMYTLVRRIFSINQIFSAFAALVFLFNGFYFHRMLIGHLAMQAYMLTPFLAYFLLRPSGGRRLKTAFDIVVSALIISYMFYSGMVNIIIPTLLSIVAVFLIMGITGNNGKTSGITIAKFIFSSLLALMITSAKLLPGIALAKYFPRDLYPLPGTRTILEGVVLAFHSIFWGNSSGIGNDTITNTQWVLGPHEYEYYISFIPLIVFVVAVVWLLKSKMELGTKIINFKRGIYTLVLLFLILLPIALNYYTPEFSAFYKKIPIIKSSALLLRWYIIYIPPLIVLMALGCQQIPWLKEREKVVYMIGAFVLIIFNLTYDREYYRNQPYSYDRIQKAYSEFRTSGKKPVIERASLFRDKDGKAFSPLPCNEIFTQGATNILCYEALFGYRLEALPFKNLRVGPVNEVKDGEYNIKNPACYIYPEENNCTAGDHFKLSQKEEMENFVHYRPFKFKVSISQSIANYLSLISLIGSAFFIFLYTIFAFQKNNFKSN